MKLNKMLSSWWNGIQSHLFPYMEAQLESEPTQKQQQLISTLELIRLEEHVPSFWGFPGRPPSCRIALARAFIAKALYNMPTTRVLIDRLKSDIQLRRICGWEKKKDMPSEASFSRAFAEFSELQLPEKAHEALIKTTHQERLVGHLSRDATAIEAREKPLKKAEKPTEPARKPGRPKKGEERPPKISKRIERQLDMTISEMLTDLPSVCDVGTKKNSKGYKESWTGYKLHLDVADGCIPISCVLTAASTHDSQVAIPLAEISAQRTSSLYDLMDSAYDDELIRQHSKQLGHVPIIDVNPRGNKALKAELVAEAKRMKLINMKNAQNIRYNERSNAERANARLKDDFGGRMVRVRGPAKVMCHLMFGVLALTADQLLRFVR